MIQRKNLVLMESQFPLDPKRTRPPLLLPLPLHFTLLKFRDPPCSSRAATAHHLRTRTRRAMIRSTYWTMVRWESLLDNGTLGVFTLSNT
jgi:hypothetical protein